MLGSVKVEHVVSGISIETYTCSDQNLSLQNSSRSMQDLPRTLCSAIHLTISGNCMENWDKTGTLISTVLRPLETPEWHQTILQFVTAGVSGVGS